MIIATATGISLALKVANVKVPKALLDTLGIMKLTGRICEGVLEKDYAVYKK